MTFEQQKNSKALAWTVGVHLLLLLIFIFSKYTLPAQPAPQDMGMEVNLGTTEDGSGTDQPQDMEDPAAATAAVAMSPAASAASSEKEINTTDDETAPAVNITPPKPTAKPNKQPTPATAVKKPATTPNNATAAKAAPAQSPRYVYQGGTGKGGNSAAENAPGTSEGIGNGNGDMGVPGGTPGASNYTGTPGAGGGSSMRVSIAGRSLVSRPDPKAEFKEGGQVVIHVTVNREGQITDSRVVRAANATIRALALKKIQSVKFNKSDSAPAEQFGDITFDFRATRK